MAAPVRLSEVEVQGELAKLPAWELKEGQIVKGWRFKDFVEAMAFVNRVAELAEAADHHPDIGIRYNRVTLTLSTHSAGGLTQKDFDLARRINS